MAIVYEGDSTANQANVAANGLTITKPTGLEVGDLMIAFLIQAGDTAAWATLAGWTALGNEARSAGTDCNLTILGKVASAGDVAASDFTFTHAGTAANGRGLLARVSGDFSLGIASLVAIDMDQQTGDPVSFEIGVTPVSTNQLLIMAVGAADSFTSSDYSIATSNPSWTEQDDTTYGTVSMAVATASRPEATATGDFTVNLSASYTVLGAIISVNETISVTVNATPLIISSTIPDATVTGTANVTVTPLIITSTIPDATVTTVAGKVTNLDKSTASSVTNLAKS